MYYVCYAKNIYIHVIVLCMKKVFISLVFKITTNETYVDILRIWKIIAYIQVFSQKISGNIYTGYFILMITEYLESRDIKKCSEPNLFSSEKDVCKW